MDIMDELINFIDEPVYDSSMLPTYLISKEAKQQGIDVLLAGNGADEILVVIVDIIKNIGTKLVAF